MVLKSTEGILLNIGSEEIGSEDQVKLVGLFIDNKLSYGEYITTYLQQESAKVYTVEPLCSGHHFRGSAVLY